MKTKMIGTINGFEAAGTATLKTASGKTIARCFNTPNQIAAAFFMFPEAVKVTKNEPFGKAVTAKREEYATRLTWIETDLEYHKSFIKKI